MLTFRNPILCLLATAIMLLHHFALSFSSVRCHGLYISYAQKTFLE